MDALTHRQVAVVASRNQDFLRLAEQERLAAKAIATGPRIKGSSAGTASVTALAFIGGLVARVRSICRPREVASHDHLIRNLVG